MSTCIFLDIDGPMIPVKAYYLPKQTKPARVFDPCAVALLLNLVEQSNAKLVISSIHRTHGFDNVKHTLKLNNIPLSVLHEDWSTTDVISTRSNEIREWLSRHPEVDNYVAIDDETLDGDVRSVKCTSHDGFGMLLYLEAKLALGVIDSTIDVSPDEQLRRMQAVLSFYKK